MEVNDYQENYQTGWISLYRSIKNHWIFENDKYFKWWVIILFEVNHDPKKFQRGYEVFTIESGQSTNSLRTWANLLNTTPKTVSNFFKLLEKDNMLKREKIGKGKQSLTLVTVENYKQYQKRSKQELPQEVNKEETKGKQTLPTNNNDNNDNNVNKEYYKGAFLTEHTWKESQCRLHKVTKESLEMYLDAYIEMADFETVKKISDIKFGFNKWMKGENKNNDKKPPKKTDYRDLAFN